MKELQELLAEASHFKDKRSQLAKGVGELDEIYRKKRESVNSNHESRIKNLEQERQTSIALIESRAKKDISYYAQMQASLQKYTEPVKSLCSERAIAAYSPNPAQVNDAELNQLIMMIGEEGILAWIKRTFKLDGYSSRAEMALDLFKKVEDACAYCREKIYAIERQAETDRNLQVTATRRKIQEENKRLLDEIQQLDRSLLDDKTQAIKKVSEFDTSAELQRMRAKIDRMNAEATNSYGMWGEYKAPTTMPKKMVLCDAKIILPNENGIDEVQTVPVWIDLFESNIIVVTSERGSISDGDSEEKQFIRKLLARMLKTIPPQCCSYSVFDSLRKGASLERLIDVTNIGTTDLNFELFTSNDADGAGVSCAERRKYLRSRLADINKHMSGRYKSLYECNDLTGDYEFPFTWYIDFSFFDGSTNNTVNDRTINDIRELFVNSSAAGYSFVFVTTPDGYKRIREIAQYSTSVSILHVDVDQAICEKNGLKVEYSNSDSPSNDQIYNFMTALKNYYEEGAQINNRINSALLTKGIEIRDATKKLRIPMALDSRGRLIDLDLGGAAGAHGFISGSTGSGKTTLLHSIILSACLHYHPDDLEIWLIDYKQTEFHLYKKNTPPHVKLIGISTTRDFTFSLLDKIHSEADRRADLFMHFNAVDLEGYRKHKGEPGYVNIPRLFIVIDEFHIMSQLVSEEQNYKAKLENVFREYRARGITCLLSDQTFSKGLSGLTPSAKNQIGLRIAMRNESSLQEVKDTLEVDRALYSDGLLRTIATMRLGDFMMKVYIRNKAGDITDIKLEKFKALHAKEGDIAPISKALKTLYRGQYKKDLLYVNTKYQVLWNDSDMIALDHVLPIRYPNIRLYLGRPATLRPCFNVDLGRQPNENLSIVGGSAEQRWELIASIFHSCNYKGYKLIVFASEYSDLMNDFGGGIRRLCNEIRNAELIVTNQEWCKKLSELDAIVDGRKNTENIICMFIGLEIANIELSRLPKRGSDNTTNRVSDRVAKVSKYAKPGTFQLNENDYENALEEEFNAMPIIDKLFSEGARNAIRCITEVSVYREFSKILKIKDMCRHRIAFDMSADDCLMYLGNGKFQQDIGKHAVYGDGSREVKKLLPYRLKEMEEEMYEP